MYGCHGEEDAAPISAPASQDSRSRSPLPPRAFGALLAKATLPLPSLQRARHHPRR